MSDDTTSKVPEDYVIGFAPYKVIRWDTLEAQSPQYPGVLMAVGSAPDGQIGFIPVYQTVEKLREHFPDDAIVGISRTMS